MLILVAHGSRDPEWRASLERLAGAVQDGPGSGEVRLAYMEFTAPTLADVVEDAARGGASRVRVLPLFMAAQGHVDRDIRPVVEELRRTHPELEIEFLSPVGQHPAFQDLVRAIASGPEGASPDSSS